MRGHLLVSAGVASSECYNSAMLASDLAAGMTGAVANLTGEKVSD